MHFKTRKTRQKQRMTRRAVWVSMVCFGLIVLLGAAYGSGRFPFRQQAAIQAAVEEQTLTMDEKADRIVAGMSLAEKVGQMMMIGVQGKDVNDDSLYMLHEYHMGGVIFFDRNMENKEQVKKFTDALQKQANEKVPLFIAVDEEGGEVARMKEAFPAPPAQKKLGQEGDPAAAELWAAKTARGLKGMGFNVNFAPVADVGSNDTRSYSKDPAVVTNFVRAAAKGYEQEKIMYSLKHFPGIGKGKVDSHIDADRIQADSKTLAREDFVPFQMMIQEKDPDGYFILVSQLTYPMLDAEQPASLSKKIVTGVLRDEMGYKGLIITDDMEMGAVAKHYDFRELGVRAVKAGVDIVMVCHEYEHETAAYNGLLKAVQDGEISQERIDDSVRRIVRAKLLNLL